LSCRPGTFHACNVLAPLRLDVTLFPFLREYPFHVFFPFPVPFPKDAAPCVLPVTHYASVMCVFFFSPPHFSTTKLPSSFRNWIGMSPPSPTFWHQPLPNYPENGLYFPLPRNYLSPLCHLSLMLSSPKFNPRALFANFFSLDPLPLAPPPCASTVLFFFFGHFSLTFSKLVFRFLSHSFPYPSRHFSVFFFPVFFVHYLHFFFWYSVNLLTFVYLI